MKAIHYRARETEGDRILLVMLPGAGILPEDFAAQGFVEAIHARSLSVDAVAAGPDLDLYLDGTVAEHLERDVIGPALARGPARLWFLGISLGGMGALLYACARARSVEGIILLAPFLGTPGLIAEVVKAGGIAAWEPGAIAANDSERKLLAWLKAYRVGMSVQPRLYLGYGRDDRFARGHALLAEHLPSRYVELAEGGHDWPTWTVLWQRILDRNPFATGAGGNPS